MWYQSHRPLSDRKHALVEPLGHTNGNTYRDTTSYGLSNAEKHTIFNQEPNSPNESKEETLPIKIVTQDDEKFVPSNAILWNKEGTPLDHSDESSTSY